MAAPRYFQTEDEKRMAAIRANPSGRPVQLVRPMRPAGSDSREKWRENAGGKMIGMDQYLENNRKMYTMENVPTAARTSAPKEQITSKNKQMAILGQYGGAQPVQGSDNRPSGVYDEKGKLVESDNRSPGVYDEKGKRISPYRPPAAPIAPTSNWQQNVIKMFPDIGKKGTAANKAYADIYNEKMSSKQPFDPMELAKDVAGKFSSDISASAPMLTVQMPTEPKPTEPKPTAPTPNMPTPQWQKDVTKIYPKIGERGTPENDAYVAEYKDRMSSKQPFDLMELADDVMARFVPNTGSNTSGAAPAPTVQSGMSSGKMPEQRPALPPLIAKTDPFGTMLNDRPGGGRTYESPFLKPRPMGSGTLSQRPTSTAPGASERVAARRAIRMNPKSTEVAQRFARGIGGARNNDSWAP